ncbi:MAG: phosphonatase-like hydrolase [Bryobacteraceae bacterium]|nr:phosphonatase-like hydrolase [Bryobacteraceae bacterium]
MLTRRQSLGRLAGSSVIASGAAAAPGRPQPPIRLVILDMGGTIIEDRGDVPETLRSAMEHHGIRSTKEEINRWRGASKREVIARFVTAQLGVGRDDLIDKIHAEFTARLIEIYKSVPPVKGAEQAIRELRSAGRLVAATTGFDRAIALSIIRRLGWEPDLAAVITSDDVPVGRPAPYMIFRAMEVARVQNVAEVAVVGDTPLDLQSANNAGVRAVIGVLTGAGTEAALHNEPHTAILPSVAGLPAFLSSKF